MGEQRNKGRRHSVQTCRRRYLGTYLGRYTQEVPGLFLPFLPPADGAKRASPPLSVVHLIAPLSVHHQLHQRVRSIPSTYTIHALVHGQRLDHVPCTPFAQSFQPPGWFAILGSRKPIKFIHLRD